VIAASGGQKRETSLMQPSAPQGPFSIRYDIRGPEIAVVLPDGNAEVLLEVTRALSQVWNGPGALLLPADLNGQLRTGLEDSLTALPPEQVLVHPSFEENAVASFSQRWPRRTNRWQTQAFKGEVHPFWLIRDDDEQPLLVHEPTPNDDEQALLASVLWGYIDPEDARALPAPYMLFGSNPAGFHRALLAGQTSGISPLEWAARHMGSTESINGPSQRALFVIDNPASYEELVLFWNLRARYPTTGGELSIVAVTTGGLADKGFSQAILEWLKRPPHSVKPDLSVAVSEASAEHATRALTDAGVKLIEGYGWTVFAELPEDRRALEFQLGPLSISQRLRRGRRNDTLIDFREGSNPVRLSLPEGMPSDLGWTGSVHVEINGLPLALPLTDELAGECHSNALATGNNAIAVGFRGEVSPIRTEITLPSYDIQLKRHMASVRLRTALSPAGRIAHALLGRLAGRGELDALAHPLAPAILNALIAPSRLKLAQRVRQELQRARIADIDEDKLARLLREQGLFLELQTRTLEQLTSATSNSVADVLAAIGSLSDGGYLQRGRTLRCPRCNTPAFWRLRELDERMRCRACRHEFPLPAIEGNKEAPTSYRLDGLMARVMDQDLLGTLLTLRLLLEQAVGGKGIAWWPGLELFEASALEAFAEIDLLFAVDGTLTVCEVKADAAGADAQAITRLMELADRVGAKRLLAAPAGQWDPAVEELCAEHRVALLGPAELVTAG
jgi:hypothetical protein